MILLVADQSGIYTARALSFPVAASVTWYLNRLWTFRERATNRVGREYVAYLLVQIIGALSNFLLYAALLHFFFEERSDKVLPALAAGAALGLTINYLGSRATVFTKTQLPTPKNNEASQ